MVIIGILGDADSGNVDVLQSFVNYIDARLPQTTSRIDDASIVKVDFSGKATLPSKDNIRETRTFHPSRVLIRIKNKMHTLFAPGGNDSPIARMSVTTISRIARVIFAVFDLSRPLDSQFDFYSAIQFIPKMVIVVLNKADLLNSNINKMIEENKKSINEYFQNKRQIKIEEFYVFAAEELDGFMDQNTACAEKILALLDEESRENIEIDMLRKSEDAPGIHVIEPAPKTMRSPDNLAPMANQKKNLVLKVMVGGDSWIGKTTFVHRFVDNKFVANSSTLSRVQVHLKKIAFGGVECILQLWDLAIPLVYRAIYPFYSSDAKGAILAFDLTRMETTLSLESSWLPIFRKEDPNLPIVLVGMKLDMVDPDSQSINHDFGTDFIAAHHLQGYFETSSKTGEKIEEAFRQLVISIFDHADIPHDLKSND